MGFIQNIKNLKNSNEIYFFASIFPHIFLVSVEVDFTCSKREWNKINIDWPKVLDVRIDPVNLRFSGPVGRHKTSALSLSFSHLLSVSLHRFPAACLSKFSF